MTGVVIVVGAGGEIGSACARHLAGLDDITVCVDRDEQAVETTVARIEAAGNRAVPAVADARDAEFATQVLETARPLGKVRAAVHAIAYEEHVAAVDISRSSITESFILGPLAAFELFRELVATAALAPGAALTLIGSLHARHPFAGALGYNMAHAALAQMVSTLALEWTPMGIRTNAVVPGWVRTRGESAFYDEEHLDTVAAMLPMGRFGSAEDIAAAVAFLSSPQAAYVSGSFLAVDGGLGSSLAVLPDGDAR